MPEENQNNQGGTQTAVANPADASTAQQSGGASQQSSGAQAGGTSQQSSGAQAGGTSQQSSGAQAGGKVSNGGVVIDENKTNEQYISDAEQNYIVPDLVRTKFSDLVKLIYETESMNEEEREYWLQILAIMSEEQIVKFRDILVNEKKQLAKLDQEYQTEMQRIKASEPKQIDELKMKEEMERIKAQEKAAEEEEKAKEAEILKELENLE